MDTQSAKGQMGILEGVIAFVEVRSNNDNRSAAIASELKQLGAKVEPTFSDSVTHVVYKEGLKRTWNRATKRGIPMVSVSWLDSCKQQKARLRESDFPAILPEESSSPLMKINQTSRWKKMKSMQPCDFDEEIARSAERGEKRRRRIMMANRFKFSEDETPTSSPMPILALETQPRSPIQMMGSLSGATNSAIPDTPPSLKERLQRMKKGHSKILLGDESPTKAPRPPTEKPLQKRLFEKLVSDFNSTGTSSDEERENTSNMVRQLIQRLSSDDASENSTKAFESVEEALDYSPPSPAESEKSDVPTSLKSVARPALISDLNDNAANSSVTVSTGNGDSSKKIAKSCHVLSIKDPNIYSHTESVLHKDASNCSDALQKSSMVYDKPVDVNKMHENLAIKTVKRRRSCRIMSRGESLKTSLPFNSNNQASCDGQSDQLLNCPSEADLTSPTAYQVKPKILKKRSLYTEPALDSSLPRATKKRKFSPDAGTAHASLELFFENSDHDLPKRTKGKLKESSYSIKTIKNVTSLNQNKRSKPRGCGSNDTNNSASESTLLGSSMSVMYGNDTLNSNEMHTSYRNRCSIDEFNLIHRSLSRVKGSSTVRKVNLEQSDTVTPASTSCIRSKNMNCQPPVTETKVSEHQSSRKRNRSSSLSKKPQNLEAHATKNCKPSSTRSSKSGYTSSSSVSSTSGTEEVLIRQPRLRHARSLVIDPPEVTSANSVQVSLVVTSLHRQEQELVYSVLKKLGVFHLNNMVETSSTHLVCGEPRRTLNLLRAIARGCWVLSKDWVFKSLEAGQWLAEEDYEMDKELPSVKVSRLARQKAGENYCIDLFTNVGLIYVARSCLPPRKELIHLIEICSGKVTGTKARASVCIGQNGEVGRTIIKPAWILDSIMNLECLPLEDYKLTAPDAFQKRESSPEF